MESQKIIIDTGSGYTKLGLSKDKKPRFVIPTAVARPKDSAAIDKSCLLIGEEALAPPEDYVAERPMVKGVIKDWDLMEKYWAEIFENELKTDVKDSSVFMTEKFKVPKNQREKKAEIFFERFDVSSLFISNGATTTLWGSRVISCFVFDFGYDYTQIVPLRNGFGFKEVVQDCDLGGKDISDYLRMFLQKRNINNISEKDLENIKKNYCFCKTKNTPKEELEKEITYELPDGKKIHIEDERFLCTQIFFTPLFGKGNLFHYFLKCLYETDNETDSTFSRTVLVSGGNSLFPGFAEEFKEVLQAYEKYTKKLNIIIKDNRDYAQFFGISEHSAASYVGSRCMTRKYYEEWGINGVHRKFFYL